MTTKLEFADLLRLIDERSADFRAPVAAAPGPRPDSLEIDGDRGLIDLLQAW